jgi:hypothetical protein
VWVKKEGGNSLSKSPPTHNLNLHRCNKAKNLTELQLTRGGKPTTIPIVGKGQMTWQLHLAQTVGAVRPNPNTTHIITAITGSGQE